MTLPFSEHAFERDVEKRYKAAGYWTRHMKTSIPGFPDRIVAKGKTSSFFIEFKHIKPDELDTQMIRHCQSTQPAQIQEMINHGVRVQIAVYCGGIVYFCDATDSHIQALIHDSVRMFFLQCQGAFYKAFLESIE